MTIKNKILFGFGGLALVGTILASSMIYKIKPGYVGVIYSPSAGVKDQTIGQGWHMVSPFNKVSEYTVATEQVYMSADKREGSKEDDSFLVPTADGKMVRVSLEYSYRFEESRVIELFNRFRGKSGEDVAQSYMRGKIKAYVSEATANFNVLDIYGSKRSELNMTTFSHVKDKLAGDGIVIESMNFSEIILDPQTAQAIQDRVNAQQQLETQRVEAEKAKIEAEKNKIIAEGAAAVAIAKAEGEAKAVKINAEAEAFAIQAKQKVITPELIQYEQMLRWNGVLPQFQGGNATPIIDFRK